MRRCDDRRTFYGLSSIEFFLQISAKFWSRVFQKDAVFEEVNTDCALDLDSQVEWLGSRDWQVDGTKIEVCLEVTEIDTRISVQPGRDWVWVSKARHLHRVCFELEERKHLFVREESFHLRRVQRKIVSAIPELREGCHWLKQSSFWMSCKRFCKKVELSVLWGSILWVRPTTWLRKYTLSEITQEVQTFKSVFWNQKQTFFIKTSIWRRKLRSLPADWKKTKER